MATYKDEICSEDEQEEMRARDAAQAARAEAHDAQEREREASIEDAEFGARWASMTEEEREAYCDEVLQDRDDEEDE